MTTKTENPIVEPCPKPKFAYVMYLVRKHPGGTEPAPEPYYSFDLSHFPSLKSQAMAYVAGKQCPPANAVNATCKDIVETNHLSAYNVARGYISNNVHQVIAEAQAYWTTCYSAACLQAAGYNTSDDCPECRTRIELTSETVATLPANRSRTTIGVGESVTIYSNIDVKWELFSGIGSIEPINSRAVRITANNKAGSIIVKASNECDVASVTFNVITPTKIEFSRAAFQSGAGQAEQMIYWNKNTKEFYMGLNMRLLPTSVNFSSLLIQELDLAGLDSGAFIDADGDKHCHLSGTHSGPCITNGPKMRIIEKFDKHNMLELTDMVGSQIGTEVNLSNLPAKSAMIYDIESQWAVVNGNQMSGAWTKLLNKAHQETVLLHNGSFTISKEGISESVNIWGSDNFGSDEWLPQN